MIKVVKGTLKSPKDVRKIMKELNIPYIDICPKKEDKQVFKWVQEQIINDGHKNDLFYLNPKIGTELENFEGELFLAGELDWEFNSNQLKELAEFLGIKNYLIEVVKLKDIR